MESHLQVEAQQPYPESGPLGRLAEYFPHDQLGWRQHVWEQKPKDNFHLTQRPVGLFCSWGQRKLLHGGI